MTTDRPRAFNSTLPVRSAPLDRKPWDRPRKKPARIPLSPAPAARPAGERSREGPEAPGAAKSILVPGRYARPGAVMRKLVLERDGYACVCCGRPVTGQPFMLLRRLRGGSDSTPNLITVLGTAKTGCAERIDSRRDPRDEANGYIVRAGQDPELVAVLLYGRIIVWLALDGQYRSGAPVQGRPRW
jgi:hypothetical protein